MAVIAQRVSRVAPTVEIATMMTVLLSFIWVWRTSFHNSWIPLVLFYFGLTLASQARRRETAEMLGLGVYNSRPAFRNVVLVVVPAAAVILATGAVMGTWHFPTWGRFITSLPWMVVWAVAQQYGLLCFFYRGFLEILGSPAAATLAAAATFAIFHVPNAFLMTVTLIAGVVACTLYRRSPNVFIMGLGHATLSFVLICALPYSVTHGLRVGPGYFAGIH